MRFIGWFRKLRLKSALIFFAIAVIGAGFFIMYLLPLPKEFMEPLPSSTKIFDRNGAILYELLDTHQGRVSYKELSQISPYLAQATIAAEDARFYKNAGVDWRGIIRALFLNVRENQIISGGSTITQQLVRNILGINQRRTLAHKIREAFYAIRLTQVFSKDKVLEMYLNRVYYGYQNYGVQAASLGYFDKNASDLDLAESAFLAGVPQAPSLYDPFKHFEVAKKRQARVLDLMVKQGYIVKEIADSAKDEPLNLAKGVLYPIKAPHFVEFVVDDLKHLYGDEVYRGLSVTTTLENGLQGEVEEIVARHVKTLAPHDVSNAAAIVLDAKSGEILAMVGSADFFNEDIGGKVNSVLSLRQPGSTIKPFTYALAFERGWGTGTVIKDEPVRFFTAQGTPYTPKNFDFEFHGLVTAREALGNSYNIPAIKTANYVGIPALLKSLQEAGFSSLTESPEYYGLALTLGDGEVRLLDLTAAYSVFARAGMQKNTTAILRVEKNGQVKDGGTSFKEKRIFSPEAAFLVTDILSDKYARLREFGVENSLEIDRPAAVKTGTSRNFKDNWTIGYTPDRITGVWVGNNDGSPMEGISGAVGAAPIWQEVMRRAHVGISPHAFIAPEGVEKREVCASGNNCTAFRSEWFIKEIPAVLSADEAQVVRITKPFDGDVFRLSTLLQDGAAQLKFEAEHSEEVVLVYWFVNEKLIGNGDTVFWKPERGRFAISAKGFDKDAKLMGESSIHIVVQ